MAGTFWANDSKLPNVKNTNIKQAKAFLKLLIIMMYKSVNDIAKIVNKGTG